MPIPVPESEQDIGLCMRFMRREKADMPNDQAVAVCMDMARKGKKNKKASEGMHKMPDGHMMKDSEMRGGY